MTRNLILSLEEGADLEAVARACEALGFAIEARLTRWGVLVGKAEAHLEDQLRELDGIEEVTREKQAVRLPAQYLPSGDSGFIH